jgi:subtilase family serine protease
MHLASILALLTLGLAGSHAPATDKITAEHPIKIRHTYTTATPSGYTPSQIRAAYKLTGNGSGTIAIIDAYDYKTAASDINTFSNAFGLGAMPACTSAGQSHCFEKVAMSRRIKANAGWAQEAALDTQWAHAIAPDAHILLVEANSANLSDLLAAVNYARNRTDVKAVSMSWGGSEFSGEAGYDSYFTSSTGASFFASSGDNGHGLSWPAVSPNVVGVGGTTLNLSGTNVLSESAWSGSGGGRSVYEAKPSFQSSQSGTKRLVPDVSYDADPATGFPVYMSTAVNRQTGWWQIGGTSAGAPQWAAIHTLGSTARHANLYSAAASSYSSHFRDITSGLNGKCGSDCTAATGYDLVTGLGSPLTTAF